VGGDNVASARRSSRQISSLGSTISSEELHVAVEICQSAGVRLVSDETYGLMTEGEPLPPAACVDRTGAVPSGEGLIHGVSNRELPTRFSLDRTDRPTAENREATMYQRAALARLFIAKGKS
jgi:hypothetical protein